MKKIISFFTDTWIGAFGLMFSIFFFIIQHFIVPSASMEPTMNTGDIFIVKKFSYGTPIPRIPFLEIPLFPDFNDNGHIISGNPPEKGDIVVFRNPKSDRQYFVKRCVASAGDEIIYYKNTFMVHSSNQEFMKKNKLIDFDNKKWALNPYIKDGANYSDTNNSGFNQLLTTKKDIDMIKKTDIKLGTYFYKKVEDNSSYMVGDNRNNSYDSRYWGSVNYRYIVGEAFFNLFGFKDNSKKMSFIE